MRALTLVAVFIAPFSFADQVPDCTKKCYRIPNTEVAQDNPCGAIDYDVDNCHCRDLKRGKTGTLFEHWKGTKVELSTDNVLHMWCHNSNCIRFHYCGITIQYHEFNDQMANNGVYVLPGYDDCCTLPAGYVDLASMHEPGW